MEKKYPFAESVDVLGVSYPIIIAKRNEAPGFKNHPSAMGYCDHAMLKIVLKDLITNDADEESKEAALIFMKRTLRHEIVHAYLFQSGLFKNSALCGNWAMNEEMVDWFAIQGPKIMKSWNEAGCAE